MILQKELIVPNRRKRKVRRALSLYREGGLRAKRALNLLERGASLVCGEGRIALGEFDETCELYRSGYSGRLYGYAERNVYFFENGQSHLIGTLSEEITALCEFPLPTGDCMLYALTENGLFWSPESGFDEVENGKGGNALCYHYERLFVAKGNTVYFSAPLAVNDWAVSVQGAGYIAFPTHSGDILSLVCYKENLYAFCERGILQIVARGDILAFQMTGVPFSCGKMVAGSVANCGEKVFFCTDSGLYTFNGGGCKRINDAPVFYSEYGVKGCSFDGKYYASVSLGGGNRAILACGEGGGYLLDLPARSVVGGTRLCYTEGKKLFAVEGKAAQTRFESESTTLNLPVGRNRIGALCIEGEGGISVTLRSDGGEVGTAHGWAGERLRLTRAVAGNVFSLTITSDDSAVRLNAVTFEAYEEGKYGH